MAATPSSIRIPDVLRARIRERARVEHRSFSSQVVALVERALAEREPLLVVDADEVERLADLARAALGEYGLSPNDPYPGPVPSLPPPEEG